MGLLEKLESFRKQGEQLKLINQTINFNKCEIKTIKGELRNIKNTINKGIYTNVKPKSTEAIERIRINNKPKLTKHKINMAGVVNEFKNIDLKTYLVKIPDDILYRQIPETNPNSYHEFIKKLKQSVEV